MAINQNLSVSKNSIKAFRGAFLDFVEDPFYVAQNQSVRYVPDGLLVVENGIVKAFGAYARLKEQFSDITASEYPGMLLMPGFIDIHVHFSQTGMIAAYGKQLLDWLNQYTFPTELKFKDREYAE